MAVDQKATSASWGGAWPPWPLAGSALVSCLILPVSFLPELIPFPYQQICPELNEEHHYILLLIIVLL